MVNKVIFSTILLFVVLIFSKAQDLLVRKDNFIEITVPLAAWSVTESHKDVKLLTECVNNAHSIKKYAIKYDSDSRLCQVGTVDFNVAEDGSGNTQILVKDVPMVGFSHGNNAGDADFEFVLPNGKFCPAPDHGLPTFNATNPLYSHGITEVDGIIYLCGGHFAGNSAGSSACFTLNLNQDDPLWEPMSAPMTRPSTITDFSRLSRRGLVPYKDENGELILFALFVFMCGPTHQDESEYIYMYKSNIWSRTVRIQLVWSSVVQDGSYIFLISGNTCTNMGQDSKDIWRYDMARPGENAIKLSHGLTHGTLAPACAIMEIWGRRGLLCAAGKWGGSPTNYVQFIPLSAEGDSSGPCEQLDPLPVQRLASVMFTYGTGEAVIYGNDVKTTLVWNAEISKFETGEDFTKDITKTAFGTLSSKWIMNKCWKHLQ